MNPQKSTNRRSFLKQTTVATAATLTIPQIVSSTFAAERSAKKTRIDKNDVILFQGDSITDWGRDRNKTGANDGGALGSGYAYLTAAELLCKFPDKNLQMYNKGVSGNKVYQLAERWDADCFALKPTVLSILVGVNDYWHTLGGGYKGTIDTYHDDYKKLIERTKQTLPDIKLIIGEPFAVKGVKAVDDKWYPAFDAYRAAAKDLADLFGATFIPYQSIFDKAQQSAPGSYWTLDGVHPSPAGASLMSHAWLEAVKG